MEFGNCFFTLPGVPPNEREPQKCERLAKYIVTTFGQLLPATYGRNSQPKLTVAPGVRIVVASPVFPKKAYRGRKETGRAVLFT